MDKPTKLPTFWIINKIENWNEQEIIFLFCFDHRRFREQ
jgi:hypothetical protein